MSKRGGNAYVCSKSVRWAILNWLIFRGRNYFNLSAPKDVVWHGFAMNAAGHLPD